METTLGDVLEIHKNKLSQKENDPYIRKEYEITTDVSIPVPNGLKKYPEISRMNVGDSIHVPGVKTSSNVISACRRHAKRTDKKFTSRREGTGLRIWRVQ